MNLPHKHAPNFQHTGRGHMPRPVLLLSIWPPRPPSERLVRSNQFWVCVSGVTDVSRGRFLWKIHNRLRGYARFAMLFFLRVYGIRDGACTPGWTVDFCRINRHRLLFLVLLNPCLGLTFDIRVSQNHILVIHTCRLIIFLAAQSRREILWCSFSQCMPWPLRFAFNAAQMV
jgi:hypothetical protein